MNSCVFCSIANDRIVAEGTLVLGFRDAYPVTEGHSLVIPKRHVSDFFDLTEDEIGEAFELLRKMRSALMDADRTITGFNIGINSGETAGQTVFHCHIHLIPRRPGDVAEPSGGVRNLIPGKGTYTDE